MVGIYPAIISHALNIDPDVHLVRQKCRTLDEESDNALHEEVKKLKENGFIRKVYYLKWIANPVLVRKPNRKGRTCIDFTNLNKACQNDSFPDLELTSW